jgi:O-antigen/teichoic acid export membrane protein
MVNKTFRWSLAKLNNFWSDSLYRNSFWLMAGSFSMAGIGVFYWFFATRLYTPTQIGLASTFLSVASLIYSFGLFGFGTTLIKFLPKSTNKEKIINTTFTIVSLSAFLLGIIYVIGIPFWTPKLIFLRESTLALFVVVIFFPLYSLNGITDSVSTAFREAHWVFLSNLTQSVVKLISLLALTSLGVWGLIGSNAIAITVAVILCMVLIKRRFGINFRPTFNLKVINEVKKFAFGNYLSGLIGGLPNMILPIIITNGISAAQTAYFNIPNMIVSILLLIPAAVSKSYFTESSHSGKLVSMKKPILVTYGVVIPIVLFLVLFGNFVLGIFGPLYAANGYLYLQLTLFSTLNYVAIYFLSNRLMVRNNMSFIVKTQIVTTILLLILVSIFLPMGINGVGYASVITSIITLGIYLYNYFFIDNSRVKTG